MNNKQRSLLAMSVFFACGAQSAGFQVAEHSASGLGRAFAGEGVVADNASVLARNPAAMTLFDKAVFSGALSFVDPEVDVYDVERKEQSSDVAPTQIVPAAYYISPINEKWAWGVGLFSNYGVATDYPTDISAGDMAGYTSLKSVNFNPNVAYRLNEQWSFGLGLNLAYAEAELTRYLGEASPAFSKAPSDKAIDMTGNTFGYGWNAAVMFELNENYRVSLAYRSAVNLGFDDGTFRDYNGNIVQNGQTSVTGKLAVKLPAILELSGFYQLTPDWAVHYSWQRTDWSSFTELKATSDQCSQDGISGQCFQKTEHYKDNDRLSIGATYLLDSKWTLRAGYAFDEQAGKPTLSIPDSDRHWYSAGVTYQWTDNLSIDAGFALVMSEKGAFQEKGALKKERRFESTGKAYISALQLNYQFN